MLPLLFPLFKAAPAVLALIGTGASVDDPVRVYRHGTAPQGVKVPYVTWAVPGGAPDNDLQGAAADFARVHVDCWADDDKQVELLANAVRAALEKGGVCVAFIADGRDFETQRFRMGYAFDFITPK